MNKKIGQIDKILSGEKTIESRWLKNKSAPWNRVRPGETIYFKDSGGPVRAKAAVDKVLQVSDLRKFKEIFSKYGKQICLTQMPTNKNYCILIFLKSPQPLKPFMINKSGFGSAAAWLTLPSISSIRI